MNEYAPEAPKPLAVFKEEIDQYAIQGGSSLDNIRFVAEEHAPELLPDIQRVIARRGLQLGIEKISAYLETKDTTATRSFGHDFHYFANAVESFDPETSALMREIYESADSVGKAGEVDYKNILDRLKGAEERYAANGSYEDEYFALGQRLGFTKDELLPLIAEYKR